MSAQMLPEHLLEQAWHLAQRERTRPKQASLRRAISTAYYALFHFLIRESVRQIGPSLSEDNFNRVYRWFDHGAMYRVAKAFSEEVVRIPNSKDMLVQGGRGIQFIAESFVYLQELRHMADYDPGTVFIRGDVLATIGRVSTAFDLWPLCKKTSEANTFLLSLLLWEKWGKQRQPAPSY
jgi:hypothetical protein